MKPAGNQNFYAMSKIVWFMFQLENIAAIAALFYAVNLTSNFTIVLVISGLFILVLMSWSISLIMK